jgi:hypothetical protein
MFKNLPKIFLMAFCVAFISGCSQNSQPAQPQITSVYTCTKNCTGSRADYLIDVYEDVEDQDRCTQLNGDWISIDSGDYYCRVAK